MTGLDLRTSPPDREHRGTPDGHGEQEEGGPGHETDVRERGPPRIDATSHTSTGRTGGRGEDTIRGHPDPRPDSGEQRSGYPGLIPSFCPLTRDSLPSYEQPSHLPLCRCHRWVSGPLASEVRASLQTPPPQSGPSLGDVLRAPLETQPARAARPVPPERPTPPPSPPR